MNSARLPRLVATATAAALALALSACGSSSADEKTDETTSLLPPAEGKVEYPLTIDAGWGEVILDERPERIVAADSYEFGLLVALGVSPVASHDVDPEQVPWSEDVLVEDPETWKWGEDPLPPEVVAKVEADLVVATSWGPDPFDKIDAIESVAPVLPQPVPDATDVSWKDQITLLGEALDLQDRAAEVIADHESQMDDIRDDHPELAGKTIGFLEFWESGDIYYSNPTGSSLQSIFERIGFATDPEGDSYPENLQISGELIGRVSTDVIVVMDYLGDDAAVDELLASPLFKQTPAAKSGQVLVVRSSDRVTLEHDDQEIGRVGLPMGYNDPIGTPTLLRLLAPLISETVA